MIDFIKATKYNCKDNIYFDNCKYVGSMYDYDTYKLDGCEEMKIRHWGDKRKLEISGSIPYYYNGHNFSITPQEVQEAFQHIDSLLGSVGIFEAVVDEFEYGVILPVDMDPRQIIRNHFARPTSKLALKYSEEDKGKFVRWERPYETLKLYDAGANIIKKQGKHRREVISESGWDPDGKYIKFEVRNKQPYLINGGHDFSVNTMVSNQFQPKLNMLLMDRYKLLDTRRSVCPPESEEMCSALSFILCSCARLEMPMEKIIQESKAIMKEHQGLTKQKRYYIRSVINKAIAGLRTPSESEWDLTDAMAQELGIEEGEE